ncbi:oligosaccharide flippase family protein [Vibrio owensii]|uniref:oligosaccharide flippase family protein n=1 Tax=Vibrio owensii TaxID=696485 RepID=UPI002893A129|nr:Membrane protein involved in the export of O-antigen, teichoic acid lipoteichoic acids [Vibrio owensii]
MRLISNIFLLGGNNLISMLTPFVIYPFLSATYGIDDFSSIVFVFAVIQFLNIVTDLGANIYVTSEVVRCKKKFEIESLISAVVISKLVISSLITTALIFFLAVTNRIDVDIFGGGSIVLCVTFQSLIPIWFYKGIDKVKNIFYFNIISRLSFLGLVLVYSTSALDWQYTFSFYAFSLLLNLASSYVWYYKLGYKIVRVTLSSVLFYVRSSIPFVYSRIALAIYGQGVTIFVGIYCESLYIVIFGVSMQLFNVIKSFYQPISEALYPKMVSSQDIYLWKKVMLFVVISFALMILVYIYFFETILTLFYDDNIVAGVNDLFTILVPALIISIVSSFYGYPLIGVFKNNKVVNRTTLEAFPLYVFLMLLIVPFSFQNNHMTFPVIILIIELFVFCRRVMFTKGLLQ